MALLGIIRRWHLRDQVSLREIAKRLGISRNTVRRYLRSETTEPAYAERQSASAIDPYAFHLAGWLKTEAAKSRKQRRSLRTPNKTSSRETNGPEAGQTHLTLFSGAVPWPKPFFLTTCGY